jgi:CheY-like chemotaxis protein
MVGLRMMDTMTRSRAASAPPAAATAWIDPRGDAAPWQRSSSAPPAGEWCRAEGVGVADRIHPTPAPRANASPPTILVVDDDHSVLELTEAVLIEAGYRVRHASDGLQALRVIEAHPPNLVLADVRMPRLDGVTLAKRLAGPSAGIPVILMSASPTTATRRWPFISKPFDIDALLALIARMLDQP